MKTRKDDVFDMFDIKSSFAGVTLIVDPINRQRTDGSDNAMALFYEEQPLMWEFVKERIANTIKTASGSIDFLDVGTGSGVWSLLVAQNIKAKNILAIDKSRRAIQIARANARRNRLDFELRQEFYNISTASYRSCKVIGVYAPYHLYPSEVERKIPQHARGGVDGQQVFKEQLLTASYHLAPGGIIVFNQMCLGKNGRPEFTKYIPQFFPDATLEYANIFPPLSSRDFLESVYGGRYSSYIDDVSRKYQQIFYCDGIISRNLKGKSGGVREIEFGLNLKERSWKDRIELHRQIAAHAK